MENKKLPELTDEQIIKALECCSQKNTCHECPYNNAFFAQLCLYLLIRDTFALIKRLKSENEELKEYKKIQPVGCPSCGRGNFSNDKFCSHCGKQLKGKSKDRKTEAIKEFAERLKEISGSCVTKANGHEIYETKMFATKAVALDNLVREMVGD